jgi:hypothetical protein
MVYVVRFDTNEDGEEEEFSDLWHYVDDHMQEGRAFCNGQVFGYGESAIEYEAKLGKITCPYCIDRIKRIKKIRL